MLLGKLEINNENKTQKIAEELFKISKVGDIFALIGDVGTGKTTLARYFIRKGGKEKIVKSPTYNIFFQYQSFKSDIYHMDAWRFEKDEEILNLGIIDLFFNSIFLIEWANKVERFLPENSLIVHLEFKENDRFLSFKGNNSWKKRLQNIYDDCN